jgi:hypothetical protein
MPGSGTRGGTPFASNAFEAEKSGYLFYIAGNGHVIGLTIPPAYSAPIPKGTSLAEALNPDLTFRTGAPPAMAGSPLASFAWESQKSQHVFYIGGEDGNVWELYYVAGQIDEKHGGPLWQQNNLSAHTGYSGDLRPRQGGPLVAFMFGNQGTEHVVYIARDQTIRELYYSGGKWAGNSLLEATQAPTPKINSPIAGYVAEYENTQHVVYVAANGDVQELYWNGAWQNRQPDLTVTTGAPQPASNSALFGWSAEYDQSEHVIYSDNSSTLWELYHTSGGWGLTNLSQSAGSGASAPVNSATPLAGYAFEYQKTDHVLYLDQNNQLHELYRSGNAWYAGEKTG